MRTLAALGLALVTALVGVPPADAQAREHALGPDGPRGEPQWQSWAGHAEAYLTAQLGPPDRVTGSRWHYENVRVGVSDGPYVIWRLTFVVRRGIVASVRARRVASVGCEISQSTDRAE